MSLRYPARRPLRGEHLRQRLFTAMESDEASVASSLDVLSHQWLRRAKNESKPPTTRSAWRVASLAARMAGWTIRHRVQGRPLDAASARAAVTFYCDLFGRLD